MGRKSSVVAHRAWDILRQLLCYRKGELCRNKLALTLHNFIGKIIHSTNKSHRGALLYGDHELSFQGTPIVHVRMHRPSTTLRFGIPCIKPRVDDHDVMWSDSEGEVSDEEIDKKAEEFITKFYEDMKVQRQIL